MKINIKLILLCIIGIMISSLLSIFIFFKVKPSGEVKYTDNKELKSTSDTDYISGVYSSSATLNSSRSIINGSIKLVKISKSVTVAANAKAAYTMGAISCGTGYTYSGVISHYNGYGDQWTVSYAEYGGNIVAMVHSKYPVSITNTLDANIICLKDAANGNGAYTR